MTTFSRVLFLFCACFTLAFSAESNDGGLKEIQGNINEISQQISDASKKKTQHETKLGKVEKEISTSLKKIRQQDQALSKLKHSLKELKASKKVLTTKLKKHESNLRDLLVRQYTHDTENEELAIILNQNNPQLIDRTLTYSRYLNKAHSELILETRQAINSLAVVEEKIQQQQNDAQLAHKQLSEQKTTLEKQRKEKKRVISKIKKDLKSKSDKLAKLQADEQRLKETLEKLRRQPPPTQKNLSFAKLKGRLPWPTPGKIRHKFGNRKGTGNLKWQGVFIATPPEQDVYAVAAGQVVFSDWLNGFGMLIIIDHGKGYITLYGQNQTLFKEVGDSVEEKEVIASVGDELDSGLYFELRHKGKPINPKHWLQKK